MTRTLLLVSITSLFNDISSEMVYPLLPFLVVGTLGGSATILGVIEGLAESIPALLKVYSGRISDRMGMRKPLVVGGYSCSLVGKALLALATGWWPVLAGRVVDRLGKGIRAAPRDALIADTTPPDQRGHAFGFNKMMDTAGAAIGVLAAYLLLSRLPAGESTDSPVRLALWLAVIPAILSVVVLLFIREKKAARAPSAPRQGMRAGWRSLPGRLRLFLLISLIFALAGSSNQFLLLRGQQMLTEDGLGPVQAAASVCLLYLLYNIVYAIASYPLGRLSDRIGRKPILIAGFVIYAGIYAAFAINQSPLVCWILFGLYGLFPALTEGVEKAFVADLAPKHLRATMLGLHGTLLALGLFPASLIGGLLWDHVAPAATFWFGAGMGLLATLALAFMPSAPPVTPAEPPTEHG